MDDSQALQELVGIFRHAHRSGAEQGEKIVRDAFAARGIQAPEAMDIDEGDGAKKSGKATAELRWQAVVALRYYTEELLKSISTGSSASELNLPGYVDLLFYCALNGYVDPGANGFLQVIGDLFEGLTIDECTIVFDSLQRRGNILGQPPFTVIDPKQEAAAAAAPKAIKKPNLIHLQVLKMCNEMLRRLSKATDAVFCGRILMYLAYLLPLNDRSGVNLKGQHNTANVIEIDEETSLAVAEDVAEIDEVADAAKASEFAGVVEKGLKRESGDPPVDFNLYRTLWSLQSYFQNPAQCVKPAEWLKFAAAVNVVLNAFASSPFHAHDNEMYKQKYQQKGGVDDFFFAKYLTSSKLVNLQLNDPYFRRHILVQLAIIVQTLRELTQTKAGRAVEIPAQQTQQLKDMNKRVREGLEATPPDGKLFASVVFDVIEREKHWIAWKHLDKCEEFVRPRDESGPPARSNTANLRKRKATNDEGPASKRHAELSRLWNMGTASLEGLESVSSAARMPALETMVEPLIEETLPENDIEEPYRKSRNSTYMWKTYRVMARESLPVMKAFVDSFEPTSGVRKSDAVDIGLPTYKKIIKKEIPAETAPGAAAPAAGEEEKLALEEVPDAGGDQTSATGGAAATGDADAAADEEEGLMAQAVEDAGRSTPVHPPEEATAMEE